MTAKVTSQLNKLVSCLRRKKNRVQLNLILVEGLHPIEEALKAGLKIQYLFTTSLQPDATISQLKQIQPFENTLLYETLSSEDMGKLATTDSPPPWLGVFTKVPSKKDKHHKTGSLIVVLDSLQEPGNVGTLIRSACAFGADALVLAPGTVDAFSPKVIRSSTGLVFRLPVWEPSESELSNWLASLEHQVLITAGESRATPYRAVNYCQNSVLIVGNEGAGIKTERYTGAKNLKTITIPMHPSVESLNVAVSASIILAEISQQKATSPAKRAR